MKRGGGKFLKFGYFTELKGKNGESFDFLSIKRL